MQQEYSLWLIPSGNVYRKFRDMIFNLSVENAFSMFEPHVTLIGGVRSSKEDMLSKTSKLAKSIGPIDIKLGDISYKDEYFMSLFVNVESKAIAEANVEAQKIFNMREKFEPHFSLMYGNFLLRKKKEIIRRIGSRFDDKFVVGSVHLFFTTGEVKYWRRIKEFKLKR